MTGAGRRVGGGAYFCPRHLLHFSPRTEETQKGKGENERKGRLKKSTVSEATIARDHTPETCSVCACVLCIFEKKKTPVYTCMCMHVRFQSIALCLPCVEKSDLHGLHYFRNSV